MGIKHDGIPLASEFASAMAVSAIKLNELLLRLNVLLPYEKSPPL
jgi:hypothetical protein